MISGGKICALGQAAVQQHYSPDRLTSPLVREGGALRPASWDKAMALLSAHVTPSGGGRRVWLTGPMSGHQLILLRNTLDAGLANDHVQYDALSNAVEASVNRRIWGVERGSAWKEHPPAATGQ